MANYINAIVQGVDPDVGPRAIATSNALRQQRMNLQQQEQQNALRGTVGNALAQNDLTGARKAAYAGGALDIGSQIDQHIAGMNEADRKRFREGVGIAAALQKKGIQGPAFAQTMQRFGYAPDEVSDLASLPPDAVQAIAQHFAGGSDPRQPKPGQDVPYSPEVEAQMIRLAQGKRGADGDEYGVTPVYYVDEAGNVGIAQLSKSGGAQVVDGLPQGARVIKPAQRVGGTLFDPLSATARADVTGDLEAGSAAEEKGKVRGQYEAELPQAMQRDQLLLDQVDIKQGIMLEDIDRAINKANLWTTGLAGSALSILPGTGASNLNKLVDTIQAQIGFNELQAMRDASKTGGALGQVAVREIELLQALLGNLRQSQTESQFKYNLTRLKKALGQMRDARQRSFDRKYSDIGKTDNVSRETSEFPNAPKVGTLKDGYRYRGGDPAQPDSWERVQ